MVPEDTAPTPPEPVTRERITATTIGYTSSAMSQMATAATAPIIPATALFR